MTSGSEKRGTHSNFGSCTEKRYHGCDKVGHLRRECADNPSKSNSGNCGCPGENQKGRMVLEVKKFRCTLHKGDNGRTCWSDCCQELARGSPEGGKKMLTAYTVLVTINLIVVQKR